MLVSSALLEYTCGWSAILSIVALLCAWKVLVIIRRIWFHPLSGIPGPKLAASTYLYHAFYDVYRVGTFHTKRPELHKKYGPAVRVSPTEVEIHDPELYHTVYSQKSKFLKDPAYYGTLGMPRSFLFTVDPQEHRVRRALVNPKLSKRAINEASNTVIYDTVEKFCGLLENYCKDGKPVPLSNAFYCVTVDVISAYAFGKSWDMLYEPGFEGDWVTSVLSMVEHVNMRIHFPAFSAVHGIIAGLFPSIIPISIQRLLQNCTDVVRGYIEADTKAKSAAIVRETNTLMDSMVNPRDPTAYRTPFPDLVEDAMAILVAGTDSTANALQYSVWNFLHRPAVKERILAELSTVERDEDGRLPLLKLEALPYFSGFIKEVLRVHHIVPGRLPRVVPEGGMTIPSTGLFIPAGTVITFYITLIHEDPRIFEDPLEFKPERWMGEEGKKLDKWLLSFSKGDRICVGINLSYAELYLVLGNLFTRFDMDLFDTSPADMEWLDYGVARPKGKLQVTIKKKSA